MSDIKALGYLGFGVSDLPGWRGYATDFLGLQPVDRPDGSIDLRMDDHAARIRLVADAADDILWLGWEVADAAALDRLRARLAAAGVSYEDGSPADVKDRQVEALIRFADCDGTPCEAYWGLLRRTEAPFLRPIGARFVTGRQGLGHVILITPDRVRTEAWYRDVLGFRVSDYVHAEMAPGMTVDFTFMRCNSRHHSLALCSVPMPKRLQHFMIEVDNIDDVGRSIYRAEDAGVHTMLSFGRHSNDNMLSVYYITPSGFAVEYGWGGLEVEDESWHVQNHAAPSAWGHRFRPPPGTPAPVPTIMHEREDA
ncbi:MAG: VOC family protein [Sphingobium sp.]